MKINARRVGSTIEMQTEETSENNNNKVDQPFGISLWNKICSIHNELTHGHHDCVYCRRQYYWDEWNKSPKRHKKPVVYALCVKHHLPFIVSGGIADLDIGKTPTYVYAHNTRRRCDRCKQEEALSLDEEIKLEHEEETKRILLYNDVMKDPDKHANEQCSNCDKHIDITEWFCYCSLCPDCYVKEDDDHADRKKERDFFSK